MKKRKKLEKLELRVKELERNQKVFSFCFGDISFQDYVRLTEKEMCRLISQSKG